jgi:hypothetical protein
MRRSAMLVLVVAGLSAAAVASGAGGHTFKATITAPTHTPRVAVKWYYVIRVTDLHGKPIAARLTMQIKDPTGQVHLVQYAATKKNIENWPIDGRFRDYIIWPRDSKLADLLGGLVLRATVRAKGDQIVLSYRVKPR